MVVAAVVGLALAFWLVRAVDARHMPPPAPLDGVSSSARPRGAWSTPVRSREVAQADILAAQVMILHPPGRALPDDFVALAYRNTGMDPGDLPAIDPAPAAGYAAQLGMRSTTQTDGVTPAGDVTRVAPGSALPAGDGDRRGSPASPAIFVGTTRAAASIAPRADASWQ
ncbi:MAG: hypothetical protein ABI920_15215 [Casimicrobiaceae bacterium]